MMNKLASGLLLVLLIALAGAGVPTAEAEPTVDWRACGGGLQCATVEVPLDYADPNGDTLDIAIARLRARDEATRIGSLLINPGGPGGSGIEFLRGYGADAPAAWHDNFDIVGFDPRGTGDSSGIDCTDTPTAMTDVDPSPENEAELDALFNAARDFAEDCDQAHGDLLRHIDTVSAARDIEAIRIALDEDQLTYFGFSYGTFLGATYAGLYPDRVRAFVLDGALDPSIPGEEWLLAQAKGFESAFDAFIADCEADPDCAFQADAGRTLLETYDAIMERIERGPLPVAGGEELNVGTAQTGVLTALYDKEFGWPFLRDSLAQAKEGQGDGLWALAGFYNERNPDGTYGDLLERYFAITCVDLQFPGTVPGYLELLQRVTAEAPRMGASVQAGTNLPCTFWPIAATGRPGAIRAAGAAPIVVVGTTNDPATPYAWAEALAGQLESGVLLTRVGEGHTAYQQGSSCIDEALDTYIVTLKPPSDGTVCAEGVVTPPTPPAPSPTPAGTPAATPPTGILPPNTGSGPAGGDDAAWALAFAVAILTIGLTSAVGMRRHPERAERR